MCGLKHKANILRITSFIVLVFVFTTLAYYLDNVKFYGEFEIRVHNLEGIDFTDFFDASLVSFLGDTIGLFHDSGILRNNPEWYGKGLILSSEYPVTDTMVLVLTLPSKKELVLTEQLFNVPEVFENGFENDGVLGKINSLWFLKLMFVFSMIVILICIFIILYSSKIMSVLIKVKKRKVVKQIFIIIILCSSLIIVLFVINRFYHPDTNGHYNVVKDFSGKSKLIIQSDTLCNASDFFTHVIVIEDTAKTGLEFVFSYNGNFGFNEDTLLSKISSTGKENTYNIDDFIFKALSFVHSTTYHKRPEIKLQRSGALLKPDLMLNSIPYGLCSDRSYVLSNLLGKAGYVTRIINIRSKHTFLEVFNRGEWVMLDPDFGLMFTNAFGNPVSFEELLADSMITPVKVYSKELFFSGFGDILDVDTLFSVLKKNYYMEEGVSYNNGRSDEFLNGYFCLPKGSKLEFPYHYRDGSATVMKIVIPGTYSGKVKVPLIIAEIRNSEISITNYIIESGILYDDFYVKGKDVEIYAYLNPVFLEHSCGMTSVELYYTGTVAPLLSSREAKDSVMLCNCLTCCNIGGYSELSVGFAEKLKVSEDKPAELIEILHSYILESEFPDERKDILERFLAQNEEVLSNNYFWFEYPEVFEYILKIFNSGESVDEMNNFINLHLALDIQ